jgi:hypothetical protein
MTASVHFSRLSTAYTGSYRGCAEWHAVDGAATVRRQTSVHAVVMLAPDRGSTPESRPVSDGSYCCEECCARRNFIRRELAADVRRARANRESVAPGEQQNNEDRPRFRMMW